DKPEFMPDYNGVIFKIVFEKNTKKIRTSFLLPYYHPLQERSKTRCVEYDKMTAEQKADYDCEKKAYSLLKKALNVRILREFKNHENIKNCGTIWVKSMGR
ncbi:MAG: hypothetical protein Q8755_03535, partial [Candidatus Phytoplasma australasiaticum]|nr:hypothetical protein [Candidatus Phytoplasma australasiaticum]